MKAIILDTSKTSNANIGVQYQIFDDKGAILLERWVNLAGNPQSAQEVLDLFIPMVKQIAESFQVEEKSILLPEIQKLIGTEIDLGPSSVEAAVVVVP